MRPWPCSRCAYALAVLRAESAHAAHEDLVKDLGQANHQLEDYSARVRPPRGRLTLYLAHAAAAARRLPEYDRCGNLSLAASLALFVTLPRLTKPERERPWLQHGCFAPAAATAVSLALLLPARAFVNVLLILLGCRAAHAFGQRAFLAWTGVLIVLVASPLADTEGPQWGLDLALESVLVAPIAIALCFPLA